MTGQYVSLERLDADEHGDDLWAAAGGEKHAGLWTWMPDGPFLTREAFDRSLKTRQAAVDVQVFAIVDASSGRAEGHATYMREDVKNRVIEVGYIVYGPALQRTRAATEAMFLMARRVFEEMGYRRYEWKCNALNAPSRRAAERLGFTFEGIFRQHMIVKGQNRDTAWFSMLDCEWPERKTAFERWLDPENFDADGRQKSALRFQVAAVPSAGSSSA